MDSAPIPVVVQQHVQEAAHLRLVRSVLVAAPHVRLLHLGRLDERIAAHLDGVAVASAHGKDLARRELERPGPGPLFVAAVRALEDGDREAFDTLLSIAEAVPESVRGLLSALGWVSANALTDVVRALLESPSPLRRASGLAACAMHAVDPGAALDEAMAASDPLLRARALNVAGRCGRRDLMQACLAAIGDPDPGCAHAGAMSALLLGERRDAVDALEWTAVAADEAPAREALQLVLKVVSMQRAQALLSRLSAEPMHARRLLRGVGSAGDVRYVPWLLKQMTDLPSARLAGEAFSLITGADLARLDLERKPPPESAEFGPTADPDDANVAMDEDDSLPWPDPARVEDWWRAHGTRLAPEVRCFMGEAPSVEHCVSVLRTGFQRQRHAASQYRCLLNPGTPLFNVRAPTRRQQRLLSSMAR